MYERYQENMDLSQIARSGQCFRMNRREEHTYSVTAYGHYLEITQKEKLFTFSCGEEEFRKVWYDYFDLDTDYGKIIRNIDRTDDYLMEAARAGCGVRILRQDLWEMIITFLISQNNNIPRIKNSIEALCCRFGARLPEAREQGEGGCAFPDAQSLAQAGLKDLQGLGLGYRDKYILSMAQAVGADTTGARWLAELRGLDYAAAHKELLVQYGIGKKVADCICLFGLHHVAAFPVDTHIRQILDLYYPQGFPLERYDGYAGILQQYLFFHKLNPVN